MSESSQLLAAEYPLHAAAERGDIDRLNALLAADAAVDAVNPKGRTPLMYAIHGGQMGAARHLLKWRASVSATTRGGWTPLQFAARGGNADAVRLLLARGADPNQMVQAEPKPAPSPEEAASLARLRERLAERRKQAGLPDAETAMAAFGLGGESQPQSSAPGVLLSAVTSGDTATVAALLESELDIGAAHPAMPVSEAAEGRNTAIAVALRASVFHSHVEIVRLLAARGGLDDDGGERLLNAAVFAQRPEMVRALVEAGADPNSGETSPLVSAVVRNDVDMAKLLLELGASPDERAESMARHQPEAAELAALFARHRGLAWHASALAGDVPGVRRAMASGAAVDARTAEADTALTLVAGRHDAKMVGALLDLGADVNARGRGGLTPLHVAIDADDAATVRLLLTRGADVDAEANRGITPIRNAWSDRRAEIRDLLIAGGARLDLPRAMLIGDVARVRQMLSEGTPVDSPDPSGMTALMGAARLRDASMAAELHDQWGADANARDALGQNAVFYVCRGSVEVGGEDDLGKLLDCLLRLGAEIDCVTASGSTPLEFATIARNAALVSALLERGADPNRVNGAHGQSLLHQIVSASRFRDDDSVVPRLLLEHGADVNARDSAGVTPLLSLLELAALPIRPSHGDAAASAVTVLPLVAILVEFGADVNARSSQGPVLAAAVSLGEVEIIRLLLARGAKSEPGDLFRFVPWRPAPTEEIMALLRRFGGLSPDAHTENPLFQRLRDRFANRRISDDRLGTLRDRMNEKWRQPWIADGIGFWPEP